MNRTAIQTLITALRAPMPKHFNWDFNTIYDEKPCGSVGCAIGLAKTIGLIDSASRAELSTALGLSLLASKAIFVPHCYADGTAESYGNTLYEEVTPFMVANKLQQLLDNEI